MIEKIVNDLNKEFGITPNSVKAQEVLDETKRQVEALKINEEHKKALWANADAIKLEQSKISLAVAEKLFSDNIKLEELKRKVQMEKENYKNSLENQAYNAAEQITPSANAMEDAKELAGENFKEEVASSQVIRELVKNEDLKRKENKKALEDVEEEGFISKLTGNLFGKKATVQETQDDSFELSDEKELKQASKNLSDDKNLDDLKENIKSQTIEEPSKIESKEETVSFNQVLSFIRDKNAIESPFADGTFSDKVNQKSLYNNFSKMNIKELRELLSDIKAKNAILEQQLENLKSGVVNEISKELKANEEMKADRKELKKLSPQNSENSIDTKELIDNIQEIAKPKNENVSAESKNISDDMADETKSILTDLAKKYGEDYGEVEEVANVAEVSSKAETEEKKTQDQAINSKEELKKLKNFDIGAMFSPESSSDSDNSNNEKQSNNDGNHYARKYQKQPKQPK